MRLYKGHGWFVDDNGKIINLKRKQSEVIQGGYNGKREI
jgi:hypothetical protein